jgi:predicted nuclease with TOPRIM domain
MINKLKEENEEIKEKLNNTRKKLTEIEGIYETKKLVLKKYYQDKEEIEKFKEEKNKMNEIIKKLRDQNNKLEKKIDVFRKKYQKQNEKDKTDE